MQCTLQLRGQIHSPIVISSGNVPPDLEALYSVPPDLGVIHSVPDTLDL